MASVGVERDGIGQGCKAFDVDETGRGWSTCDCVNVSQLTCQSHELGDMPDLLTSGSGSKPTSHNQPAS